MYETAEQKNRIEFCFLKAYLYLNDIFFTSSFVKKFDVLLAEPLVVGRWMCTRGIESGVEIKKGELPRLKCFHNGIILIVLNDIIRILIDKTKNGDYGSTQSPS